MNKILIILILLSVSIQQFNLKLSKLINSIDNIELASNLDSFEDNTNDDINDIDYLDFDIVDFDKEAPSLQYQISNVCSIPIYIQKYILIPNLTIYTAPPKYIIG